MARKEMITIDKILDTAFAMTREEGFANVTARRVAAKAGCSTQPIFRVYKNMEELWDAVYERAAATSTMKRIAMRVSLLAPQNASTTNSLLLDSSFLAISFTAAHVS